MFKRYNKGPCYTKKCKSSNCCGIKEYFISSYNALVGTLKITPRVITYNTKLHVGQVYENVINVVNKAVYPRVVLFSCDSNDVSLKVYPRRKLNNFIEVEESLQVLVTIIPTENLNINRRRSIFIRSLHPNIIIDVPILVLPTLQNMGVPQSITFPKTCHNSCTFYEMLYYNKTKLNVNYVIQSLPKNLNIVNTSNRTLPKCSYLKMLFKLNVHDQNSVTNVLKVKFSPNMYISVEYSHQSIPWSFYVHSARLNFKPSKFEETTECYVQICNESMNEICCYLEIADSQQNHYNPSEITANNHISEVVLDERYKTNLDPNASIHFNYEARSVALSTNTLSRCRIYFRPIMHAKLDIDDNENPPFFVQSYLLVQSKDELYTQKVYVALNGFIEGADIDLIPKVINLYDVYLGEEHCYKIKAYNIDKIDNVHLKYNRNNVYEKCKINVTPAEGFLLNPCCYGIFHLQFYSLAVGKFMEKLEFKVKNGGTFSAFIKGKTLQIGCRCYPDALYLGTIPVAVPQKLSFLVINPLAVPVTMKCVANDDGTETPLVLNIQNVDEHLPIDVLDPIQRTAKCFKEEVDSNSIDKHECEVRSEISLLSQRSAVPESDSYSNEFTDVIVYSIPKVAKSFINTINKSKCLQKHDCEKCILDETLTQLLSMDYFQGMDKHKNYKLMDWSLISNDPKEIYILNDTFYLLPNGNKTISFVLIPNNIGSKQRYINIRICPHSSCELEDNDDNFESYINSTTMITKLLVDYVCGVPEITWDSVISMEDKLYVGEMYDFEMVFKNRSDIGGFFFYEVVPNSADGAMKLHENIWKYFIKPASTINVKCTVQFRKVGNICLSGLIRFVGVAVGYPFHIKSMVLPTKINAEPKTIYKRFKVLTHVRIHQFIYNASPTTTWFCVKLNDYKNAWVEPLGGQLAPAGQGTYITLNVYYKDPGAVRNVLEIHMQYDCDIVKIPILLVAEGMPIIFEPEIRNEGVNFGKVSCITEQDYINGQVNAIKTIKVINAGERSYRLVFKRLKNSQTTKCSIEASKARTTLEPKFLTLLPESESFIELSAMSCEEVELYNEFRIQIIDANDKNSVQSSRMVVKAEFVQPKVSWNTREIIMYYYRTHKYMEHPQWRLIYLNNNTNIPLYSVKLKVIGPFQVKELFEDQFVKDLEFHMQPCETKEIFLLLESDKLKQSNNNLYEGRITCSANCIAQKPAHLKVKIFTPALILENNNIIQFTDNKENTIYLMLQNTQKLKAIYKWSKISEEWRYIKEEDDVQQVAEIVLSNILRMLDLDAPELENDPEMNLTARYQKYRSYLQKMDQRQQRLVNEMKSILYDIINNLDLTHKRYKLEYVEPRKKDTSSHTIYFQVDEIEESEQSKGGQFDTAEMILQDGNTVRNVYKLPKMCTYRLDQLNELLDAKCSLSGHKSLHEQLQIAIEKAFNISTDAITAKMDLLEECLSDAILFFNQNFYIESPVIESSDNSKGECAVDALDHILDNLKLDDSYTISEASSQVCETERSIYFLEKYGIVNEKQQLMCAIHKPPVRPGFQVHAIFQLNVIGGKSVIFEITLINLIDILKIDRKSVYVGTKPWYEKFHVKFCVENTTNYKLKLDIEDLHQREINKKLPKIISGYAKLSSPNSIELPAFEKAYINAEGLLGFTDVFIRDLLITINNGPTVKLRITGNGVMPTFIMTDAKVQLMPREPAEIIEEYILLKSIYYFEMFRAITYQDEELSVKAEEDISRKSDSVRLTNAFSSLSTVSEEMNSDQISKQEYNFYRLLQSYVWVNVNFELPNAMILEQLLQTQKFIKRVRSNPDIYPLLKLVYQNYNQNAKPCDDRKDVFRPTKYFTIQPLPYELNIYIFNMQQIKLNQFHKFEIDVEFFGPGKFIACARTAIKIPGFIVDLKVVETNSIHNLDYTYYTCEDRKNCPPKPYRNMFERQIDYENKLKHYHTFDMDAEMRHQHRMLVNNDRRCIFNYYNSLNKSVYLEQKHHMIHCKLFNNCKQQYINIKLRISLLFKPEKKYFVDQQHLEDFLYIDIHMGPTLPILLQGRIVKNYSQIVPFL